MARRIPENFSESSVLPVNMPANMMDEMPLPPLPRPINWPSAAPEQHASETPADPANKHGTPPRRQAIVGRKKKSA